MRGQELLPVLALAERHGSTGGQELDVLDAEKAKDRLQIRLDVIERGHLRPSIVHPAGRNDEGRLLAREQTLRLAVYIGKGLSRTADLIDPELEYGLNSEVVHGNANHPLVSFLKFPEECVGEGQEVLLLFRVRGLRCKRGSNPCGCQGWDRDRIQAVFHWATKVAVRSRETDMP